MVTATARRDNGESCVIAPVTRTVGIGLLNQLLKALATRSRLSDNMGHMLV